MLFILHAPCTFAQVVSDGETRPRLIQYVYCILMDKRNGFTTTTTTSTSHPNFPTYHRPNKRTQDNRLSSPRAEKSRESPPSNVPRFPEPASSFVSSSSRLSDQRCVCVSGVRDGGERTRAGFANLVLIDIATHEADDEGTVVLEECDRKHRAVNMYVASNNDYKMIRNTSGTS